MLNRFSTNRLGGNTIYASSRDFARGDQQFA